MTKVGDGEEIEEEDGAGDKVEIVELRISHPQVQTAPFWDSLASHQTLYHKREKDFSKGTPMKTL